jgi:hypothetical protein
MMGLPIVVWVLLVAGAFFVGEYILLRLRRSKHHATSEAARRRLTRFATALHHYARDHLQRLPESLAELNLPESQEVAYRPIPRLNLDPRLILLHDALPTQKIIEFPVLRDGRGVIFCNGRLHLVAEEVFEKLLAADNALRERLGLDAIELRSR